ncbi:hypothetical protein BGW37DRAFT_507620 [Umbelopsis sp. PMI_123]|nr:hypothetical protein BGW37DRAFT_507620 [Umbelopsis sp. PMI_123]
MLLFTNPLYIYDEENPSDIQKFFDPEASFWTNDWVSAYSAVRHSNGKVYVTTNLNSFHELDPVGRKYKKVSQSTWAFCRLVSYENQLLCFGAQLTVVDPATGSSEIWMKGNGILDGYWSRTRAATVHMSNIYVATQSNCLYCINSDRKATKLPSKNNWSTCKALLSLDGHLYATLGKALYQVNTDTGDITELAVMKTQIKCGTVDSNNCIYIVANDGSLFKLEGTELVFVLKAPELGVASTIA